MYILSDPLVILLGSFTIGLLLTSILFFVTVFFGVRDFRIEKNSPYECGFQPFEDSRNKVDIKYYLVAILYIIFDLEIMFLLPWILYRLQGSFLEASIFSIFFLLLVVGFVYEWLKGALKWS